MKTSCELEKKLKKLPAYIRVDSIIYYLQINKTYDYSNINKILWNIEYIDVYTGNYILNIVHQSIQAAVDTALKEIKVLQNIK